MVKLYFDFGHGGIDTGAKAFGVNEKDLILAIGLIALKDLKRHNIEVVTTRTTDKTVSLRERSNKANKEKVDFFVSLHCNWFKDPKVHGLDTHIWTHTTKSENFAKIVNDEIFKSGLFRNNRGVKRSNFHVLRETYAPAILIELGFMSNKEENQILQNKQKELGLAISKAILKALNIKYIDLEKPKPKPEPKTKGFYRVVTDSYRIKDNAIQRQKELKAKGINTFLVYYDEP